MPTCQCCRYRNPTNPDNSTEGRGDIRLLNSIQEIMQVVLEHLERKVGGQKNDFEFALWGIRDILRAA